MYSSETGGKSATGATRCSKFWVRSSEHFSLQTASPVALFSRVALLTLVARHSTIS